MYFAAAWLGLNIVVISGQVSPVWFASGVGIYVAHVMGARYAFGIFLGACAASASTGAPVGFWTVSALGNATEALVVATLLRRFSFRAALDRARDVGVFFGAVVAGAFASAVLGAGAMTLSGVVDSDLLWRVLGVWWLGNFMGGLIVTPALLTLRARAPVERRHPLELLALAALLAAVSLIVFGDFIPRDLSLYAQGFLLFPPVAWAALRFGPRGAAVASLVASAVAIWGTATGRGPFAHQDVVEGVVVLQCFMALLLTTSALMAAAFAERQAAGALLVLSERLASVGLVAAGVGHELKNPLSYVSLNLELLSRELDALERRAPGETTRARRALEDALQGTRRVSDVASGLKLLSREAAQERDLVRLENLVPLTLALTRHELGGRVQLQTDLQPTPPLWVNEARLGQVLLNLLLNAIQAIPPERRGVVTLRAGVDPDGFVRLEVEDNGTGIRREHQARLFEPFFTTRPSGVGTGLGLFITKEIIREHRGTVAVRSRLGQGTTFTVRLPPAPEAELRRDAPRTLAPAADAELPAASAPKRRPKVLIVDDEARLSLSMRLLLEPGHEVSSSATATEALSRMLGGESFDVILCDLNLPDLSGMDLYEQLRQGAPALAERLVFVTGGAVTEASLAFVRQVSNPVLEKPVPPELLLQTVARLSREMGRSA